MSRTERTFSSAQVAQIVSEWMAQKLGVPLPVRHEARWLLMDGQLVVVLSIEPVGNVARMDNSRRATKRLRLGKAGKT